MVEVERLENVKKKKLSVVGLFLGESVKLNKFSTQKNFNIEHFLILRTHNYPTNLLKTLESPFNFLRVQS